MEALLDVGQSKACSTTEVKAEASADLLRAARCRCAEYVRRLGVSDPDVLARFSSLMVQRAKEQLAGANLQVLHSRLIPTTLETTESYVQKWISAIEKQIDLHGGISRCGELATRVQSVLAEQPAAIESVEAAAELFKQDASLSMSAQPPNNPTKFACQPLTASQGGLISELVSTLVNALRLGMPAYKRRHA